MGMGIRSGINKSKIQHIPMFAGRQDSSRQHMIMVLLVNSAPRHASKDEPSVKNDNNPTLPRPPDIVNTALPSA
jgi:hypothetical protein